MYECKVCGTCCLFYPITPLTKEEEESGHYDIGRRTNGIAYLSTKKIWHPRLKKQLVVCVYYDVHTQLCFMHGDYKPTVCIEEHCWGTQCRLEWELTERNRMTLLSEVI